MPEFPQGFITLVFTDIEGSSALWELHGEAFAPVLNEHNLLMRQAAANHGGVEVKTEGDAFFLVFDQAAGAVQFALEAQQSLRDKNWTEILAPVTEIRVRMGLHGGVPIFAKHPDGQADYFGPVVNRAARVGGAGHGGQVVVSDGTRDAALAALGAGVLWQDLGRHRLKGVGEERLWQVWLPGMPQSFPPLKTMMGAKHNLPQPGTPFIGRGAEIEKTVALLRTPGINQVTLLGFGGQGKTRLALQVAEQLVEEFEDGVWWVELEEARDGEGMLGRIAQELRLHLRPQPTLQEQVLEFHRDRNLLLLLDNTEQIPGAGAVVQKILAAGKGVKCLVTSRKALDIRGEQRVSVPPLPPEESLQLFASVARSKSEGFELAEAEWPQVMELCQSLENVPLAIELAAARAGTLSPDQMLARLDQRFKLLQSRSPDLPPRQRALRGAIDWSYDLLETSEQELLAALAVFSGGFYLEDAEAIFPDLDVLDGVELLESHSLLRPERQGAAPRFFLQESVRAYAAEKLMSAGTDAEHRGSHARHYTALAAKLAKSLHTAKEGASLKLAALERSNMGTALGWSAANNEPLLAAQSAVALFDLLHPMGLWEEADHCLTQVLPIVSRLEVAWQARLELRRASLAHDRGEEDAARVAALWVIDKVLAPEDPQTLANAHNLLGLLETDAGNLVAAEAHFHKTLAGPDPEDHHIKAVALHNLARLASRQGEAAQAQSLYTKALEQRRAGGDKRGEAETLGNLGALAHIQGSAILAKGQYVASLQLREELQDRLGIGLMLHNLGELAQEAGEFQRAVVLFVHSRRLFGELGSSFAAASAEALATLQTTLGDQFTPMAVMAAEADWHEWLV